MKLEKLSNFENIFLQTFLSSRIQYNVRFIPNDSDMHWEQEHFIVSNNLKEKLTIKSSQLITFVRWTFRTQDCYVTFIMF